MSRMKQSDREQRTSIQASPPPQAVAGDVEATAPDDVRVVIPQLDRDSVPAAMASLWRAMVALPTGHPALRSLQKCEDATAEEAVPMLKMCAAALRLMHLNASAEHVERAMELMSGLRSAAT